MQIANSRVLITGGAAGLGRIFAEQLLLSEAIVAVVDCNKENLMQLIDENTEVKGLECDVSNYEQVGKTFAELEEQWGVPDVLINNAGIIHSRLLYNPLDHSHKKHTLEEWQKVIDINLTGTFNVTTHWVEKMIPMRKKGVVINISSVCAQGNPGQSAYSASKAGIEALTKTWSKELGPRGIRSVAIAPGYTNSMGTKQMIGSDLLTNIVENTPLRRLGDIIEIYSAIQFGIENDFLNGVVLSLDGGLSI